MEAKTMESPTVLKAGTLTSGSGDITASQGDEKRLSSVTDAKNLFREFADDFKNICLPDNLHNGVLTVYVVKNHVAVTCEGSNGQKQIKIKILHQDGKYTVSGDVVPREET